MKMENKLIILKVTLGNDFSMAEEFEQAIDHINNLVNKMNEFSEYKVTCITIKNNIIGNNVECIYPNVILVSSEKEMERYISKDIQEQIKKLTETITNAEKR